MQQQPRRASADPSRRAWLQTLAGGLAAAALPPPAGAQSTAASAEDRAPPPPAVGSRLALPEVTLLDGSVFRPADAEGRVLLIYWWASWCPFCAQQSPAIEKLWLSQRGRGLQMLALSIDRKAEDASTYLHKRAYSFPTGLVTPAVARVLPKPKGLPVTLVRGRDGKVLAAEVGQLFPEDVEQLARFV